MKDFVVQDLVCCGMTLIFNALLNFELVKSRGTEDTSFAEKLGN